MSPRFGLNPSVGTDGAACDRCGKTPDADLLRYTIGEADEDVRRLALCPECGYGFNRMMAAYVAYRDASATAANAEDPS